jgi:hypothetical protein
VHHAHRQVFSFEGGESVQTWAWNSLFTISRSSLITGIHHEQVEQQITLPAGVFFQTITRFISYFRPLGSAMRLI